MRQENCEWNWLSCRLDGDGDDDDDDSCFIKIHKNKKRKTCMLVCGACRFLNLDYVYVKRNCGRKNCIIALKCGIHVGWTI